MVRTSSLLIFIPGRRDHRVVLSVSSVRSVVSSYKRIIKSRNWRSQAYKAAGLFGQALRERIKRYGIHNILASGGIVIAYGFILRFQTQDTLDFVCELLKEKSSHFKLRKFFNPDNVPCRFILVIECTQTDMVEFLENYFLRLYSGDVDISLLNDHESEIDKMKPI